MRWLAAIGGLLVAACASSTAVPGSWTQVPAAAVISPADVCARVHCHLRESLDVRVAGGKLVRGEKALTPEFKSIDSFDVSGERKEVVFSAKRNDDFDVGLVSIDGSDVHWVPNDPSDETGVQWGTRANMISYVVHAATGDVVRTVHVSTAFQFLADFGYARVDGVAWEPGDRFHVTVSSVESSPRVESFKYNATERRVETPPAATLDVALEAVPGGVLLRPSAMRYNETLPLVVWVAPDFAWSDARAALMRDARVACAVVRREPDAAFWSAVEGTRWIDRARTYVVGASGTRPQTTYIASSGVENGRYRRAGDTLLVSPRLVQSFAAGFIADQLKGTPPRNGHR